INPCGSRSARYACRRNSIGASWPKMSSKVVTESLESLERSKHLLVHRLHILIGVNHTVAFRIRLGLLEVSLAHVLVVFHRSQLDAVLCQLGLYLFRKRQEKLGLYAA